MKAPLGQLRHHIPVGLACSIWDNGLKAVVDVELKHGDNEQVEAIYDQTRVRIERRGDRLECSCDCGSGDLCTAISATLIVADGHGHLIPDDDTDALEITIQGQAHEEEDWMEGDAEQLEELAATAAELAVEAQAARARRRGADGAESWKTRIADVHRAMLRQVEPAPLPTKELCYVVDAVATEASDGARGPLVIELATRGLRKDGTYGALKRAVIRRGQIEALPEDDARIVAFLAGPRIDRRGSGPKVDANSRVATELALTTTQALQLLPAMCDTGRCMVRRDPTLDPRTLEWDDGPAWEFWLETRGNPGGDGYTVTGTFRRGNDVLEMHVPDLVHSSGLLFVRGRVSRLEHFGAYPWIPELRRGPIVVPRAGAAALQAQLLDTPVLPRLYLPEELRSREATIVARPTLSLRKREPENPKNRSYEGHLGFDYGGSKLRFRDPNTGFFDVSHRTRVTRDRAAERDSFQHLIDLGFQHARSGDADVTLDGEALPHVVRSLLEAGFEVDVEGGQLRTPGKVAIEVTSGIDWFELDATVDYEGTSVGVPELLAAMRDGKMALRLGDGSYGVVPEDWLADNRVLLESAKNHDGQLRYARSQLPLVDALLEAEGEVRADETFEKARRALRTFDGIQGAKAPRRFRGELRPYQEEGLGWLRFLQTYGFGGCLADDMGLGKTVQMLALLAGRARERKEGDVRPSLVVAPRSLMHHWESEAKRFAPRLVVHVHFGAGREIPEDGFAEYDLVITTYGTMRQDIVSLSGIDLDYCVLDESQAIKNPNTKTSKSVRLLKARNRVALSGTPVENHIGELWSLFEYLNPGMLGSAAGFKKEYGSGASDQSRDRLARVLRPFVLRRTKGKVARELPEKLEQTLFCDLEGKQLKRYDELRQFYRASLLRRIDDQGLQKSKMHVLEALLRLRQAACHVGLIDKSRVDEPSAKLDLLLEQLEQVMDEGHKAIVFSQFTSLLAILRTHLDERKVNYEYLDGRTRKRAERVQRFQEDKDCTLFLVSLKAGGLGLNLTAAEYVYLLDPWWNPAVEAQAIDRAHRIGQTRRVFAYRIIGRGTIEEKVLELQERKRDLADAIIKADTSLIRDLKREDLELLLS